jgi:hypothetical protein
MFASNREILALAGSAGGGNRGQSLLESKYRIRGSAFDLRICQSKGLNRLCN